MYYVCVINVIPNEYHLEHAAPVEQKRALVDFVGHIVGT